MFEWILQPWPWYVAGPAIALTLFLVLYLGESLGVSAVSRTVCAACGAGRKAKFFDYNWKKDTWNLVFVAGIFFGGLIGGHLLTAGPYEVALAASTRTQLAGLGIRDFRGMIPADLFAWEQLLTLRGLIFMVGGGFLVGFGARYAGGCTSGHAISGLSNLQLPSLIAVVGFFIGGLLVTFGLMPWLMSL